MGKQGGEPAELDVRLLGPIEVRRGGRPLELPGGRARSLLVLLALGGDQAVPADRLIDELWGEEAPATARTLLQGFVSRLRKVLGSEAIETTGNGYRLAVGESDLDANRFRDLVAESRDLDGPAREDRLAEALALWRGTALADVTYEPFAQRVITALDDHRLTAREELAEARLGLGRHADLIGELEGLVVQHPYRERLPELLALALYRAGRQAEALEALRRARATLVEELGLEPAPGLQALEKRILEQDPALDAPSSTTGRGRAGAASWIPDQRRTVTVLFVEATPVGGDLDPESSYDATRTALDAATEALRAHGGRVQESPGGVVVGWFGMPSSHDDNPLRAARAARDARDAVDALPGPPFSFRAGLETGEVVASVADAGSAAGPVTTAAARLQQAADPGDVLLGPRCTKDLRGVVVVEPVRDRDLQAWRMLGVDPSASLIARDLDVRMVGREGELTRLRTVLSRAVRQSTAHRMLVIGEAGIGKSRLSRAFVESIEDRATTATAACPDGAGGQTFRLVHDLLVQAGGSTTWEAVEQVLERADPGLGGRLAGITGVGELQGSPQEFFGDMRRALEVFAHDRPLALVIDDGHWADQTFLDLVEYLTEALTSPVLLLLLARPELVEDHPTWSGGGEHTDLLHLDPLDVDAVAELIRDRAPGQLDHDDEQRIIAAAQGNPLFAEQLVAAWADGEAGPVPSSLRGLIAARIDRLGPAERDLLRTAAVAGEQLSQRSVGILAPAVAQPFLERNIATLVRTRLLQSSGRTGLEFPHGLIRDAAYQSLTRKDRGRLHLLLGDWLEQAGEGTHLDAVVGHHLEQAVENRRLALRVSVAQHLAEASLPLGDHVRAQDLTGQVAVMPGIREEDRWLARLENARSSLMTSPGRLTDEEASTVAREALAFFEEGANPGGKAQAHFLLGWLHQRTGDPIRAVEAGRRSLEIARDGGATRERTAAGWLITRNLIDGPTPVPDCIDGIRSLVGEGSEKNPIVMCGLAPPVDHGR